VFKSGDGITVELTRRRESKHPAPHHASYKTRSRRSRPTICSVAQPLPPLPLRPLRSVSRSELVCIRRLKEADPFAQPLLVNAEGLLRQIRVAPRQPVQELALRHFRVIQLAARPKFGRPPSERFALVATPEAVLQDDIDAEHKYTPCKIPKRLLDRIARQGERRARDVSSIQPRDPLVRA